LFHVHAEGGIFTRRETAPETEFRASAGKHIERGQTLGNLQRMVIGQKHDGVAQTQRARALRGGGEQQIRRARMRVLAHEVMLDEPGRAEAAGLGDGELFEGFPVYLAFVSPGEIRHRQFVEQIEVHAA
jgi:hypothetical protein